MKGNAMRVLVHTGPVVGQENVGFFITDAHARQLNEELWHWMEKLPDEIRRYLKAVMVVPQKRTGPDCKLRITCEIGEDDWRFEAVEDVVYNIHCPKKEVFRFYYQKRSLRESLVGMLNLRLNLTMERHERRHKHLSEKLADLRVSAA